MTEKRRRAHHCLINNRFNKIINDLCERLLRGLGSANLRRIPIHAELSGGTPNFHRRQKHIRITAILNVVLHALTHLLDDLGRILLDLLIPLPADGKVEAKNGTY